MPNKFMILLVEDNADDEHLSLRQLRRLGPSVCVEVARDGEEALRRLTDPRECLPDLVLTDLKLPKIGGLELLRRLRADLRTAALHVVVLSGSDEPEDVEAACRVLADGFAPKPISIEALLEVCGELRALHLNAGAV
jgi:two-component system response regulator